MAARRTESTLRLSRTLHRSLPLIDHSTPAESEPTGEHFAFEYGAAKQDGGQGFAEVFKRGYFGWEYKGKHANLDKAYGQLLQYRSDLQNPSLLVVCDMDCIVIVPDPACGSGNFLYLALALLLDLWKEVSNFMIELGYARLIPMPDVAPSPLQLHGLEKARARHSRMPSSSAPPTLRVGHDAGAAVGAE